MQGDDKHEIRVEVESTEYSFDVDVSVTWDQLFAAIAPSLLNEATNEQLRSALRSFVGARGKAQFRANRKNRGYEVLKTSVDGTQIDTCIVQFRALGLIMESQRKRSVTDTGKYWSTLPTVTTNSSNSGR